MRACKTRLSACGHSLPSDLRGVEQLPRGILLDLVEQRSLAASAAARLVLNGRANRGGIQAAGELQALDFGGDFAEFRERFDVSQLSLKIRLTRGQHLQETGFTGFVTLLGDVEILLSVRQDIVLESLHLFETGLVAAERVGQQIAEHKLGAFDLGARDADIGRGTGDVALVAIEDRQRQGNQLVMSVSIVVAAILAE